MKFDNCDALNTIIRTDSNKDIATSSGCSSPPPTNYVWTLVEDSPQTITTAFGGDPFTIGNTNSPTHFEIADLEPSSVADGTYGVQLKVTETYSGLTS